MYSEPCATLPDLCNLLVVWAGWFPVPFRFERYSELLMPQSPIRFSTSTIWVSEIVVLRNLDTYWDKGRLRVVSKVIQKGAWHRKTMENAHFRIGGAWLKCMQSAKKKVFSRVSVLSQGHWTSSNTCLPLGSIRCTLQWLTLTNPKHAIKSLWFCLSMVGVYVLCLPQHLFGIPLARQVILRIEARHGCRGKRVWIEYLQKSTPFQR